MREAQIYLKNIKKIRKEKTNGGGVSSQMELGDVPKGSWGSLPSRGVNISLHSRLLKKGREHQYLQV